MKWNLRIWPALAALGAFFALAATALATESAPTSATKPAVGLPVTLISISAVIGFVLPPIIDAIKREKWTSHQKAICAFAACVAAAVITCWWQQTVDWKDFRVSAAAILGVAMTSYGHFWSPSGISDTISKATG